MEHIEWDKVGMTTDWMWNDKNHPRAEGDEITGRYVERQDHIGDNDSSVHVIETQSKERVGIWGSMVLDGRMSRVAIGKMVKIVYLGRKDSPNRKGKQYHDYDVYQGRDYPLDESR